MDASQLWSHRIPIFSDVFLFTYPVYLLALYVYGMATRKFSYKLSAIFIFFGTLLSGVANIIIQFFFDKARPNVILGLADLKHQNMFSQYLPSSSFPSDHAAVTMGIAFASIVRWVKHKDKKYFRFGWILIIFSLITSFSRVTTAVHRPTDVIAGSIVGIAIPWLLMNKNIYNLVERLNKQIGKII